MFPIVKSHQIPRTKLTESAFTQLWARGREQYMQTLPTGIVTPGGTRGGRLGPSMRVCHHD